MTEERKTDLLSNLVFWATEVINNDEDIAHTLHEGIGFTRNELEDFDVEVPEGFYEKLYSYISDCADADYLYGTLTPGDLGTIEKILFNNNHNIVNLEVPRTKYGEVDFDGEWKVMVQDNSREGTEIEKIVLKWFEGYADTGYMADVVSGTISADAPHPHYENDHNGGFAMGGM